MFVYRYPLVSFSPALLLWFIVQIIIHDNDLHSGPFSSIINPYPHPSFPLRTLCCVPSYFPPQQPTFSVRYGLWFASPMVLAIPPTFTSPYDSMPSSFPQHFVLLLAFQNCPVLFNHNFIITVLP